MWDPYDDGIGVKQRGSYLQKVVPPTAEICDVPLYCLSVNQQWLNYLAGAAMQLAQPSTWKTDDPSAREIACRRATDLIAEIANAVPCEQTPYQPPGVDTAQQACNIAGYLANVVIRQAMDKALSAAQQDLSVLNFGLVIIRLIPGVGFVYPAFAAAVTGFLQNIIAGNVTHYGDAIGDDTLWAQVTCAIYNAIQTDGDVTDANFPAVQAALCALTYTYSDVTGAICNWVSDLGVANILQAQQTGVLASYTCTCTGTPGIVPPSGYLPPSQASGTARVLIAAGQSLGQLLVTLATGFGTTPIVIPGTDDPIMLPSVSSVGPGSFYAVVEAARPVEIDTYVDVDWIALPPGQL